MADDLENVQNEQTEDQQDERTFTQAEVDNLINQRLARERRGMPKAEELAAFRAWQKEHPADQATHEEQQQNNDNENELEIVRRENHLLKQGVPADDVDYYVYKISKMVDENTSFEDAAKKFLKENKRGLVRMDTGARLNGGGNSGKSANEQMNALLRKARG